MIRLAVPRLQDAASAWTGPPSVALSKASHWEAGNARPVQRFCPLRVLDSQGVLMFLLTPRHAIAF